MRSEEAYKREAYYQIWVRSFKDGNGDGIGDLYGVYEKLGYVKSLGVDGIWFSPLYPSPNADFGYDISDYTDIHPDYGDLRQFKKVLERAHELGLKIIMDLVINHTSDEHEWFKKSRERIEPYTDYYIWRDKPNNWDSFLEGKAWEYDPVRGQYYLHLFAKKQPDLNMDNPKVREEIEKILRFWLDMGVDGFREDVINFISKKEGLPNGLPFIPIANGLPYYKDGPHIHEYLKQFRDVCRPYGALQIGEGPLTTVKSALKYESGPDRTLDMMFSFDHMMADCIFTEYIHRPFSLIKYKKALSKWQHGLAGRGWNALYIENHDHPRIVSRYGSMHHHEKSAQALCASYIFLQGTPFIYQGQEIGMTNIRLKDIDQYVDVSTKNNFNRFNLKKSIEERMELIYHSSRDSSRTPVQWNDTQNAGFSEHEPWFYVNENYSQINVARQQKSSGSVLGFYKKALALRKMSRTLIYGRYREFFPKHPLIYMYERAYGNIRYLVVISFSDAPLPVKRPKQYRGLKLHKILTNYDGTSKLLRPWEVRVYRAHVICR